MVRAGQYYEGKPRYKTRDIVNISGKAIAATARLPENIEPAERVARFDMARLTNRRSLRPGTSPLLHAIISRPRPWEHPAYDELMRTRVVKDEQTGGTTLQVNLGSARISRCEARVGLNWIGRGGKKQAIAGPSAATVEAYPIAADKPTSIKVLGETNLTSPYAGLSGIHSLEVRREPAGYRVRTEVLNNSSMQGTGLRVGLALLDQKGRSWRRRRMRSFATAQKAIHSRN